MNCQVISLFPTPVMSVEDFITEQERLNLFEKIKNMHHFPHDALIGNSYSTYCEEKQCFLDDNFRNRISIQLNNFANIWGVPCLELDNCWSNIQGKDSQLISHRHPRSIVSGALYINVNENSSRLYFFNPNPHNRFDYYKEFNDFNYNQIAFEPKNRQLLLFPSWLEHGSYGEKNQMDDRIVISFNSCCN